jgi:hypothetical protein
MTPKNVNNPILKDFNDRKVDEILNIKLKRMIRMINEIKEDMYKHLKAFKGNTNKWLNKLKDDTNKQQDEMRKVMQDMKEKFSNAIEVLKIIQVKIPEIITPISQIKKISVESLSGLTVGSQIDIRISELEDKLDVIEKSDEDKEKRMTK